MANTTPRYSNSTLSLYHSCPPGLGGDDCQSATCNSTFVPPSSRSLKPANVATCPRCTDGFGGLNCNICQSADSCGTAATSLNIRPAAGETLTCHQGPRPISTTQLQCNINQPTLSTFYHPGKSIVMTMTKVVQPDNTTFTGLPSWPAVGGTTTSQVWLDGVMQYYCQASNCSSTNSTTPVSMGGSGGSDVWTCSDLKCYCPPTTAMCSGNGGGIAMEGIVNQLSGTLSMPCDYGEDGKTKCQFKGGQLTTYLGEAGLPLEDCTFSSCVTQSELSAFWLSSASKSSQAKEKGDALSGPVIGGIVVLCVVVAALLGLLLCGWWQRRRAQRRPKGGEAVRAVGVAWEDVDYRVSRKAAPKWLGGSKTSAPLHDDAESPHQEKTHGDTLPSLGAAAAHGHILHHVSGHAPPGSLVAILGPSGAGKTTLVELLAGKEKSGAFKGNIRLDGAGEDLSATSSGRRLLAFVDQEDQLPAYSTVREALRFAAELTLPENVPEEEKRGIVQSVITTLGLGAVADSIIGERGRRGISGGEKRRVSIGIALVARPRILVLDEPLSGLDAYNAARVMMALRQLASGDHEGGAGTTVILTLHQPSSQMFHMLDQAILLSAGRTFYAGPPGEAMRWCEETMGHPCPRGHNVADHLLEIAMRTSGTGQEDHSGGSSPKREAAAAQTGQMIPRTTSTTTTWFTQVRALTRRYLSTAKRDAAGALAHLVGHIVLGLIVGGAFFHVATTISGFQNRVGSLYFLFMLMLFASMSAMTSIHAVRPLMARERSDGLYSPWAFLVAHGTYDIVFLRLIPGLLLSTILYWMVGLRSSAASFFEYLLLALIFYIDTTLYMLLLGSLFTNLSLSILGASTFILLNIAFGGFLLNLSTIPPVLRWIQWLAPMKYALEGVTQHEIKGLQVNDRVGGVPVGISAELIAPGLFSLTGSYYRDLLVLALGFTVGYALLLAGAVWWRMRDRR